MRPSLHLLLLASLLLACTKEIDLASPGGTGGSGGSAGNGGSAGSAGSATAGSAGSATAGQGGSAGAAGGQSGSGGSGTNVCDPATNYVGKPCTGGERCVDGKVVWHCKNGIEGGFLVADYRVWDLEGWGGPIPDSCTPEGEWLLQKGPPTSSTPFECNLPGPTTPGRLNMSIDIDGSLLSSQDGLFDPDHCSLWMTQSSPFNNQSESWTEKWEMRIGFDSSTSATGTYKRSSNGFCQGSDEGPLVITKLP